MRRILAYVLVCVLMCCMSGQAISASSQDYVDEEIGVQFTFSDRWKIAAEDDWDWRGGDSNTKLIIYSRDYAATTIKYDVIADKKFTRQSIETASESEVKKWLSTYLYDSAVKPKVSKIEKKQYGDNTFYLTSYSKSYYQADVAVTTMEGSLLLFYYSVSMIF